MTAAIPDALLRHQSYLEGFKLGTALIFRTVYLPTITDDLKRRFAVIKEPTLDDLNKVSAAQLINNVMNDMNKMFGAYKSNMMGFLRSYMEAELKILGAIEPETAVLAKPLYGPLASTPSRTGRDRLWALIATAPIPGVGSSVSGAFDILASAASNNSGMLIRRAIGNNLSPKETLDAFVGESSALFGNALMGRVEKQNIAVVATVIQHISQMVAAAVFSVHHSDYTYAAVLDATTTDICAQRNGKVFTFGDGPLPPAHYQCRAYIMPGKQDVQPNFAEWLADQPAGIRRDMFANHNGKHVPRAISLDDYTAKLENMQA